MKNNNYIVVKGKQYIKIEEWQKLWNIIQNTLEFLEKYNISWEIGDTIIEIKQYLKDKLP